MFHITCNVIFAKRNITIWKLSDEVNKAEQAVSIKEEKATMSLRKSFDQHFDRNATGIKAARFKIIF